MFRKRKNKKGYISLEWIIVASLLLLFTGAYVPSIYDDGVRTYEVITENNKKLVYTEIDEGLGVYITGDGETIHRPQYGDDDVVPPQNTGDAFDDKAHVAEVVANPTTVTLDVGESKKISYSLTSTIPGEEIENKGVTWTSENKNVAHVAQDGTITAIAPGSTTVTIRTHDNNKTAYISVTVNPILAEDIILNTQKIKIPSGGTFQIEATVIPTDATNKECTFTVEDDSVAIVDENGLVTGMDVTRDNYQTHVIVRNGNVEKKILVEVEGEIIATTDITLEKDVYTVEVGSKVKVNADVVPSNATIQNFIYRSLDEYYATISATGYITGQNPGQTHIEVCNTGGDFYGAEVCRSAMVNVIEASHPIEGIAISYESSTLQSGETMSPTVTYTPTNTTNKALLWSSSNPEYVKVDDNGVVTGMKNGTAMITATSVSNPTITSSFQITTTGYVSHVTSVEILDTDLTLKVGDQHQLNVVVNPEDATNKELTFSTSDTSIATIDINGTITAIRPGEVVVTATANDNGTAASITVIVTAIATDSVSWDITPNANEEKVVELDKGQSQTVTVTVLPDNATDKSLYYESSNTSVAEYKDGKVVANGYGEATITVYGANNTSDLLHVIIEEPKPTEITITPNPIEMKVGETEKSDIAITPNDANQEVYLNPNANTTSIMVTQYNRSCRTDVNTGEQICTVTKSSEEQEAEIIRINDDGTITALNPGTATIDVTAVGDMSVTAQLTVEVTPILSTGVNVESANPMVFTELNTSKYIYATLSPLEVSNQELIFYAENEGIVSVDETGKVTALNYGEQNVYVIAADSVTYDADGNMDLENCIKETVVVQVVDTAIHATGLTTPDAEEHTIYVGDQLQLKAIIEPDNATDQNLMWSSGDTTVATVDSSTGLVTGISRGTSVITVSHADGFELNFYVTVKNKDITKFIVSPNQLVMDIGATSKYTIDSEPNVLLTSDYIVNIYDSEGNESYIVDVDKSTNTITALAEGTAYIEFEVPDLIIEDDYSNFIGSIQVIVKKGAGFWDGTSESEPENENGTCTVKTAANLAWIAANPNYCTVVDFQNDISLGGFTMNTIDSTSITTIEGNGHSVSSGEFSGGYMFETTPNIINNFTYKEINSAFSHYSSYDEKVTINNLTIEDCTTQGHLLVASLRKGADINGLTLKNNVSSEIITTVYETLNINVMDVYDCEYSTFAGTLSGEAIMKNFRIVTQAAQPLFSFFEPAAETNNNISLYNFYIVQKENEIPSVNDILYNSDTVIGDVVAQYGYYQTDDENPADPILTTYGFIGKGYSEMYNVQSFVTTLNQAAATNSAYLPWKFVENDYPILTSSETTTIELINDELVVFTGLSNNVDVDTSYTSVPDGYTASKITCTSLNSNIISVDKNTCKATAGQASGTTIIRVTYDGKYWDDVEVTSIKLTEEYSDPAALTTPINQALVRDAAKELIEYKLPTADTWQARIKTTFTITYELNGGSLSNDAPDTYSSINGLSSLPTPTRTGYTFLGWTGSNGSTPETNVSIPAGSTGNKTFTANWKAVDYTITYNLNGGENPSGTPSTYTIESATITLPTPTRTGYTFNGWYTESDFSGNKATSIIAGSTGNKTYYASWTAKDYDVQFNGNGSTSGSMSSQSFTYDKAQNLNENKYKREYVITFNYNGSGASNTTATATSTFNGWATSATGAKVYDDKASVKNLATEGTYNLYANWTLGSVILPTPTRTGYIFEGWNTLENGNGTSYDAGESISPTAAVTLYAQWSASSYSIKFNGNGSTSGSMTNQEFVYDTAQNLKANAFGRSYVVTFNYNGNGKANTTATATYTFNGWATSANGSKVYDDKASVKNLATGGTYNLYANWTSGSVTLPSASRTGYTFLGWYDAATGGTRIGGANDTYSPTTTKTLYAQWSANTYVIKYNGNNGSGTVANQNATYDKEITLQANGFTYEGHTFTGWNTKADGTGTAYSASTAYKNLATSGEVTLYAQWKVNTYTITYKANGGTGDDQTQTVTYGVSWTTKDAIYSKTGYTQSSWNTKADGSGTKYALNASQTDKQLSNVILYAQWTANTYNVKFNGNNATSGSMSNQSFTYDVAQNLSANTFKRAYTITFNYNGSGASDTTATATSTFDGWATSATGSKAYDDKASVKNLATNGTFNLYATWKLGSITLPTPDRTGYTFAGWNTKADGSGTAYEGGQSISPTTAITLYAQWDTGSYVVKFNGNGSTSGSMTNQSFEYDKAQNLKANTFVRAYTVTYNYNGSGASDTTATATSTFNGWATSALGTKVYDDKASVKNLASSGTFNLYANWTLGSVTLPSASRTGYTFTGWNTAADGSGTTYASGATYTPSKNTTLYAQWTANAYTIKYNGNGSTSGSVSSQDTTYDKEITLRANGFARTGYTFTGWNTKADGTGTAYSASTAYKNLATSGEVTLYAQWKGNSYSVKFNGNGSTSGSMSNQTFTYDVAQNLTANAFKRAYTVTYNYNGSGASNTTATATYTFSGWATSATGSKAYDDKASVKNLTTSGTYNLYATWTSKSVTLPSPTRTGYTFNGWYDAETGGNKIGNAGATYTPTANTTLYAQWTINSYTLKIDPNGGYRASDSSTSVISVTKNYGTSENISERKRNGYTLSGYAMKNTSSGSTTDIGGATFTFDSSAKTGVFVQGSVPITLTAQWSPNSYKATLDNQGATTAGTTAYWYLFNTTKVIDGETVYYYTDANCTSPLSGYTITKPTKAGYTFGGYYTGTNGTGTQYVNANGQCINNLYGAVSSDITLYAKWTPNTYKVTLDNQSATTAGTAAYWYQFNTTKVINGVTAYYYSDADLTTPLTSGYYITLPTKTGYTFGGYYTGTNGSGTQYVDASGQCVNNLYRAGTSNITLYAKWTANTYTVTYKANGGTGDDQTQTTTYGTAWTTKGAIYTKTGYTQTSWNTAADGSGTKYSLSTAQTNKQLSNVTLYAQWTADTYTIKYDGNGATGGSTASHTVAYNESVTIAGNGFTKTGHTFAGWSTKSDGTDDGYGWTGWSGTWKYVDGQYGIANKTLTLYARWTPITYTINYDGNGATGGSVASHTVKYGNSVKISDGGFTRDGYTFLGWSTKSDNSNDGYGWSKADGTGWSGTWSYVDGQYGIANKTLNLYARWSPIDYTITYNLDGGTSSNPTTYNAETSTFSLATPTRAGYTFAGWTENTNGLGEIEASSDIADGYVTIDENTISMQVTQSGYTFSGFKVQLYNGSTYVEQLLFYAAAGTHTTDYTFSGTTGNYFLRFGANGNNKDACIRIPVYLENGKTYTFSWTQEVPSTQKIVIKDFKFGTKGGTLVNIPNNVVSKGSTGNRTYTASWTPNSYKLTINPNGGTWGGNTSSSTYTAQLGTSIYIPEPYRTGYQFNGWTQSSGINMTSYGTMVHADTQFVNSLNVNGIYNNSGNGTVTHTKTTDSSNPYGSSANVIKITTNGTASPGAGGFIQHPASSTVNSTYYHVIVAKVPVGYSLSPAANSYLGGSAYWITSNAGTGKYETYIYRVDTGSDTSTLSWGYTPGQIGDFGYVYITGNNNTSVTWYVAYTNMIHATTNTGNVASGLYTVGTSDASLTANWKGNPYTITYNANGGSVSTTSQGVTYGSAIGTMPTPTRTGYSFNGWYTATSGGTKYTASSTWDQTANDTLYAQWTKTHAVVTVVNGFGTTLSTNYVASGGTLSLSNPSVTGYSFKSWTASGCSVSGSKVTVSGTTNCTVTANWTAVNNGATSNSTWTYKAVSVTVTANSGSGITYYTDPTDSTTCENAGANVAAGSTYTKGQTRSISNATYYCVKVCGSANNADGTSRCSAATRYNLRSDTNAPTVPTYTQIGYSPWTVTTTANGCNANRGSNYAFVKMYGAYAYSQSSSLSSAKSISAYAYCDGTKTAEFPSYFLSVSWGTNCRTVSVNPGTWFSYWWMRLTTRCNATGYEKTWKDTETGIVAA